jgi:hypothetical protein
MLSASTSRGYILRACVCNVVAAAAAAAAAASSLLQHMMTPEDLFTSVQGCSKVV